MAHRVSPVAIPAPVAELVEAWNARSADRFAAALAHDARIHVPPLHLDLHGRDEAWDGVARLFGAFGALRYTSRHRYLTPDGVTDEVLLEGLQTREFLGAPPPGRPGAVAARVMMRHDGRQITSLTIWPDVAALRELSAGMARRIDLRSTDPAAPVVAALRATIPATEGKLSVGQERQHGEVLVPADATLLPGGPPAPEAPPDRRSARAKGKDKGKDGKGTDKAGPKAPLSRSARRLRGIAAGVLMLGLAGVLAGYVAQGVRGAKPDVRSAGPAARPTASPTAKGSRGGASSSTAPSGSRSAAPKPVGILQPADEHLHLHEQDPVRDQQQCAPAGGPQGPAGGGRRAQGTEAVRRGRRDRLHRRHRRDHDNLRLSLARAQVVKTFLMSLLPVEHFTVRAYGRGETNFAVQNTSEANREQNRRVQIVVPKPSNS